jgi:hypothetical protein
MTNIKIAIYQKLTALAITPEIYDGDLPDDVSYPVTAYDLIDEVPTGRTHDAVAPFREARIQIDVYAASVAAADVLIEQYFQALQSCDEQLADGESPETVFDASIRYESTNPRMRFISEPTLADVYGRSMDFIVLYK